MERIAKFEKVSFEQYYADRRNILAFGTSEEEARKEWEAIKLPARATTGSAGYDFFLPVSLVAVSHDPVLVPTGVRCKITPGWGLFLFPKSGLGFKNGMRLGNTIGLVDADYYDSDNEGHIMAKFTAGYKPLQLTQGQKFIQGVFLPFGISEDDEADGVRNGGFGSTGK